MKITDELSCAELVELVTDYLEGALGERDRERFEEHLSFCGYCQTYLDQVRTTVRVTGQLSENDLDPQMAERLLDAFHGWKRE